MGHQQIETNRAPVLTMWAAVVAERLGFGWEEALTLGRAVAGLNAQSKGRRLGIFEPGEEKAKKARRKRAPFQVSLLGRKVPVKNTKEGIRALKDREPMDPQSVRRYLHGKFGDDYEAVRSAMRSLADAFDQQELAERAYDLYETFRPEVPKGKEGWGTKGKLNLRQLRGLTQRAA